MTTQAVSRPTGVSGDSDIHMLIPFDEIVAGATVRVAVIKGTQYLSVRDIIMHLCEKNNDEAGLVWRRMTPERLEELRSFCTNFKFPGRGQQDQPVITFPGALKLVMFLPGEAAKQHRASMVTILQRYFAGDPSLLQEIETNAASDSAIAQLARASLAGAGSVEDSLDRKRKRDLEDTQLHALKLKNIDTFTTVMERINPNWRDDARLRLKTEDWAKNVAFNNGVPAITNGEQVLTQPISVSQIGQEMGYNLKHGQLCKVGHAVAEMYRAKYGEEPSTHWQWVDGQHRKVKSYTERDRELIEEAIAEVMQ